MDSEPCASRVLDSQGKGSRKKASQSMCECKKLYSLPPERIQVDTPPFVNVGVDCFGPITVRNYRSELKRYGCVFTCMTTRAIHVEKLNSLDTDTFINGDLSHAEAMCQRYFQITVGI